MIELLEYPEAEAPEVVANAIARIREDWETWTFSEGDGSTALLVPIGHVNEVYIDQDDPWYPDFQGQREPFIYVLLGVTRQGVYTGKAAPLHVELWDGMSPYDGVSHLLWNGGWTVPIPEYEMCEHGMSKASCEGPMHWHDD